MDIHCPDLRGKGQPIRNNWDHRKCVERFELADEFDTENPCVNFGKGDRICTELARYEWYRALGETP